MTKFKTRNDVPEKVRSQVIDLLQQQLSNAIDLSLQAKQAHWNVKGPTFIAMHELFDKVAEEIEDQVDLLAERIVQYGGVAAGTLQAVGKKTELPEYPANAVSAAEHINALSHSMSSFGESARAGIETCDKLGDKVTADLLTEVTRANDKNLWFVEAHLQSE